MIPKLCFHTGNGKSISIMPKSCFPSREWGGGSIPMGSMKMEHSSRDQTLIGPYRVEVCSPGSSSDSRKSGVLIWTLLCSGESSSIPKVSLL